MSQPKKRGPVYLAILAVGKLDEHKGLDFHSFDGYAAPIICILEGCTDSFASLKTRAVHAEIADWIGSAQRIFAVLCYG